MQNLYRYFDAEGVLLYVGVSLNAINRLGQHKNNAHWFGDIARVDIEQFETRKNALDAEKKAIIKENPLHNLYRPKVKSALPCCDQKGDMREVIVYTFKWVDNRHNKKVEDGRGLAKFHAWGCDCENFQAGSGNYSTAIVEREDGSVENIRVNLVKFVSA